MPSAVRTKAACLSDAAKEALRQAPYAYGNGYVTQALRTIDIRLDGYVPQEVDASTSKGELLFYIGDLERALQMIREVVDNALAVASEVDAANAEQRASFARQHSEEAH